ncbi:hypothetical protein [Streptomyces sp. NPDC053427]|uniref:hypothetical protein n=1 Tax=Streptomyces sp. NPDC053427 TaxID=3365701 RepID=UPI0037D371BF
MRKAVRRLAAATGVLVAGAALPLVVTAPAQAATKQCTSYLAGKGYIVGPKVRAACAYAADINNGPERTMICTGKLHNIGVTFQHGSEACGRAV